jgi:hypothetical protein
MWKLNAIMKTPLQTVIITLVTILIGLTLVKIVEARLSDVSINMPRITINLPDSGNMLGGAGSTPAAYPKTAETVIPGEAGPLTADNDTLCRANIKPPRFDSKAYRSRSMAIVPPSIRVPEASRYPVEIPAPLPRDMNAALAEPEPPRALAGESVRYYKDPDSMTPEQRLKFKNRAKLANMTVADYEAWLMLHREEQERLSGLHRENLRILLRGGRLRVDDMPKSYPLPHKSDYEYLEKVMSSPYASQNIPQPESHGYYASNFDSLAPGGKYEPEVRTLKHLAYVNPDQRMKTMELTHVSHRPQDIPLDREVVKSSLVEINNRLQDAMILLEK